MGNAFSEEWSQASQVLDLLMNITRACCSIQDLHAIMDKDGDGLVTEKEFSNAARKLVGRQVTTAEMKLMFKAFDVDNAGVLTYQNVIDGLEVQDVWNAALRNSELSQPSLCSKARSLSDII